MTIEVKRVDYKSSPTSVSICIARYTGVGDAAVYVDGEQNIRRAFALKDEDGVLNTTISTDIAEWIDDETAATAIVAELNRLDG